MDNKKIPTSIGAIVLVIIAITVGVFVWAYEKNQPDDIGSAQILGGIRNNQIAQTITKSQQEQPVSTLSQLATSSDQKAAPAKVVTQPKMPTAADEAGKSPEQLVKDFYEWYIGNTDYYYYRVYQLNENKRPINIPQLILESPFISSTFENNMRKTSEGDPVLCSQDIDHNVFKQTENLVISGNVAKIFAVIELVSDPQLDIKIQVMLKKENKQWKIDEINCSEFRF